MTKKKFKHLEKEVREIARKVGYDSLQEIILKSKEILRDYNIKYGDENDQYQKILHVSNALILERNDRGEFWKRTGREEIQKPVAEEQEYIKTIENLLKIE